jgi:hypothetical protein
MLWTSAKSVSFNVAVFPPGIFWCLIYAEPNSKTVLIQVTMPHTVLYICTWARLLKQETWITVYCLPIKENKITCSISVCNKQMEVAVAVYIYMRETELYMYIR